MSLMSNALYVTSLFPYLPFLTADMTGLTDERLVVSVGGCGGEAGWCGAVRVVRCGVWLVWYGARVVRCGAVVCAM